MFDWVIYKLQKESSKSRGVLEPKQASMMEVFCEYVQRRTIFAIKAPSQMFDWVIYKPPKILTFPK